MFPFLHAELADLLCVCPCDFIEPSFGIKIQPFCVFNKRVKITQITRTLLTIIFPPWKETKSPNALHEMVGEQLIMRLVL